jgi:hypothetical protein
LPWLEGQALCSAKGSKKSRLWLEEEMSDLEERRIMLPLKLAENHASVLCKMSAQAHGKYGHGILSTKS